MSGDAPPIPSGRRHILPPLYNDGRIANQEERYSKLRGGELVEDLKKEKYISDGFAVVDPRFVGFSFPSYTFIYTKTDQNEEQSNERAADSQIDSRLEQAFDANRSGFDRPDKALMLGTVLGDFDIVHRRVDENRYANARFVKDAKMNEFESDLDFFQDLETYPVFEIIRWHGKDSPSPLNTAPDQLTPVQLEIIRQLRNDASMSDDDIRDKIRDIADNSENDLLISEKEAQTMTVNYIEKERESLKENDIILGYSIDYDPNHFHLNHALMGITVEPGESNTSGEENGDEGSHRKVREALLNNLDDQEYDENYLNNLTMPYITSGVGQNWGDIIVELRLEDPGQVNQIANKFRKLPGVRSTRTYLMTQTNFDASFDIDNYHTLATNGN